MKYFIHEIPEPAKSAEISPWFKYMYMHNIFNAINIYFVQSNIESMHNVHRLYKPAM